jgi:hypothetical protein
MTVAGTITNAAGAGLGLLTVTNTTYGNINAGHRIDLPSDIYIVSQIPGTNNPASKTFSSGGVPASDPSTSRLITLTDVTGLIVGNTLTGTGIENGSFILEINPTGSPANTVRIEDAVTAQAAGTYTVSGGLGTYIVDTSVMASNIGGAAVNLFDFPEIDNYKPLKSLVPEGNTGSFTNGKVVRETVTNVPANSATYRRWFVKARMGIKKRYGEFSVAGDVDFEEGRFPYNPNPSGSGGAGVFTSVDINNTTPWLTFSTQPDGVNPQYGIRGKSTQDDAWFVGGGSVGDDLGYLELATGDNAGTPNQGGEIYVRQYNNGSTPPLGVPWEGGTGVVVNELVLLDEDGNTVIPKNLTVDSGTLFVDSTNNRVGINNTSPQYELHIDNGSDGINQFAMTNSDRTFIITNDAGNELLSFNYGGNNKLQFDANTGYQWFNSGNTGINTATPAYTLDVNGTANIETSLTVPSISTLTGDDLNITAFSGRDVTISTTAAADPVTIVRNTTATDSSVRTLTLRNNTTGTPAVGFGNTLEYEIETAPGVTKAAAFIDVSATNVSTGTETFQMSFGLMNAGSTYTTVASLNSLGNLQIDGDLQIDGGDITLLGSSNRIRLGSPTTPDGFVATGSSISGTTLTIGTVTSGTIIIGQEITGTGVTTKTKITANISGSGSGSTWTVSDSQSVSSTTISGYGAYTLPIALPTTTGLVLTSSVSGTLSWIPVTSASGGDVVGPSSSTDNAIARFNGTTGKIIQNSGITISDSEWVEGVERLYMKNALVIIPTEAPSPASGAGGVIAQSSYPSELGQTYIHTIYKKSR